MSELISRYDCALFDLDGVLYLGPEVVAGAPEAIDGIRSRDVQIGFVTNNAARSPQAVAEHLTELGIPAQVEDVVTSSQAGARMLATQLEPGSKVLVVGTTALAHEVELVGLVPVWTADDEPAAVIQGYDPQMTWPRLDEACYAIQAGAKWFATNTDANRPTNRGRVPGAGAQVAAVASSVTGKPQVAGKPYRPLLDETISRLGAAHPIFVGDRIDTDIEGASAVGMDSLFVFTGTHGKHDLAKASVAGRPTHIGWGAGDLLLPAREVELSTDSAQCGDQVVEVRDGALRLGALPQDLPGQLDALWAALALAWRAPWVDISAVDALNLVP